MTSIQIYEPGGAIFTHTHTEALRHHCHLYTLPLAQESLDKRVLSLLFTAKPRLAEESTVTRDRHREPNAYNREISLSLPSPPSTRSRLFPPLQQHSSAMCVRVRVRLCACMLARVAMTTGVHGSQVLDTLSDQGM